MPQTVRTRRKPSPSANSDVLTLEEAARFLKVTPQKLKHWVAEFGLPGRNMGEDWRFLQSAIVKWLDPQPTYAGPSNAQFGALADDPSFDDLLARVNSYRHPNGVERA